MPGIGTINLKVAIHDSDIYALQAINSYLAWDRRTRVSFMTRELGMLWTYLHQVAEPELPDVVIMDSDHLGGVRGLTDTVAQLRHYVPEAGLLFMGQNLNLPLVEAAASAGAQAFLLKHEVRIHIAWATVYALDQDFTVTASIARASRTTRVRRLFDAAVLPEQREYPEMTERIRQAIQLCVIEGMPAHLAADEMGISLHTIRGYIKEGYRILESYDTYEYPPDMTPQERAFMRFTALASET